MSKSATQQRVQAYLEKHKVGPLFEDLMESLIRERPAEPLLHLIKLLNRRAQDCGLPIPSNSRNSSTEQRNKVSGSSSLLKNNTKTGQNSALLQSSEDVQVSQKEKHKSQPISIKESTDHLGENMLTSTANVRFDGPKKSSVNFEDPLADELPLVQTSVIKDCAFEDKQNGVRKLTKSDKVHILGARRAAAERQRRELFAFAQSKQTTVNSGDSGLASDEDDDDDVEAVHLLEDLDELMAEGGVVFKDQHGFASCVIRSKRLGVQSETQIKVAFCARCAKVLSGGTECDFASELFGSHIEPASNGFSIYNETYIRKESKLEDEESDKETVTSSRICNSDIESASQVSGPRHPVWTLEDEAMKKRTMKQSRLKNDAMHVFDSFDATRAETKERDVESLSELGNKAKAWHLDDNSSGGEEEHVTLKSQTRLVKRHVKL